MLAEFIFYQKKIHYPSVVVLDNTILGHADVAVNVECVLSSVTTPVVVVSQHIPIPPSLHVASH